MKVCDVCQRTSAEPECRVESVFIGTTIDVARAESTMPVAVELCTDCILNVNAELAAFLRTRFGLVIRM